MMTSEPIIFYFDGEGLVAAILVNGEKRLIIRASIEHRILEGRQHNYKTPQEERALTLMQRHSLPSAVSTNVRRLDSCRAA